MVQFILIILLISFSTLGSEVPDVKTIARENAEILGVDKNKNEVRDEVEEYISKHLHKADQKIYHAYFNYAQTLSLQLKHRYDNKMMNKLDMQLYKDTYCIFGLDIQESMYKDIKELRRKVLESDQRIRAWEISAGTRSINTFPSYMKKDWIKQCR